MQKFFKYKWAVDGETTAVPNAVDPSGYVSYRQGYGADYSRVYGTDPLAKAPERVKLNAVLQDITAELQSLQVHGYPDYITSALNDGTAYAYDIGAVVRWTDNKNYRNTVAGNTNDPSVSGWEVNGDTSNLAPKANPVFTGTVSVESSIVFEGATADAYETTLTVTDPTADRTITLPNESGTVALLSTVFSAYQTAASTSLTTNTNTKVLLTTEEFDTDAQFDAANSKFQPTIAGYYHIDATVRFGAASFSGEASAQLYKNGAGYKIEIKTPVATANKHYSTISEEVYMNGTTDYLELYCIANGTTLVTVGGGTTSTRFSGYLVRRA